VIHGPAAEGLIKKGARMQKLTGRNISIMKTRTSTPLGFRLANLKALASALLSEVEEMSQMQPAQVSNINIHDEVRRYEMELIKQALKMAEGNQARAARLLGINATTLSYKIKRYNIPV
jgi:transcriptional regulator with GAF, ATPase, and Fis domain